jgi:hypothetical protein
MQASDPKVPKVIPGRYWRGVLKRRDWVPAVFDPKGPNLNPGLFEPLSAQVNLPNSYFGLVPLRRYAENPMEYKGVEYTVVQLTEGVGWRWEVRFDDGKNKSGVTPVSRAVAIKQAEYEIDRVLKNRP